jgi:hypothetical protein
MTTQTFSPTSGSATKEGIADVMLEDFARRPERQRGLWNFLTWSFFLAQVMAANGLIATGAQAGQTDDGMAHHDADSSGNVDLNALAAQADIDSSNTGAAGKTLATILTEQQNGEAGKLIGDITALPAEAGGVSEAQGPAGSSGANVLLASASEGSNEASTADNLPTTEGVVLPPGVGIDLDLGPGPDLGLDIGLGPLGGIGLDLGLGNGLGIDLDARLAGIDLGVDLGLAQGLNLALNLDLGAADLGLDLGLDDGINLAADLGNLGLDLGLDFGNGIALNLGVAGLDLGLELPSPVAGLLGGSNGTLGQQLASSPVLDSLLSTATGPLIDLTQGLGGSSDVVGSGGLVTFASSLLDGAQPDDLFTGGRYTDYNLALNSPSASPAGGTLETASDVAGDLISTIDTLTAPDGSGGSDQNVASLVGLPSAIEELGLRGTIDGLV